MKQLLLLTVLFVCSCQISDSKAKKTKIKSLEADLSAQNLDTATLAGGCFWCMEAAYEQIQGVVAAVSGYAGGTQKDANYKKVGGGSTNHAETIQIYYDPAVIDYATLLDIFFVAHDPTQVNRQGPDVGPQYRSAIFYHNEEQKKLAKQKMDALASAFDKPIATELALLATFYPAEDYHQDFEKNNPNHPYILSVSKPKIDRVAKKFKKLFKKE